MEEIRFSTYFLQKKKRKKRSITIKKPHSESKQKTKKSKIPQFLSYNSHIHNPPANNRKLKIYRVLVKIFHTIKKCPMSKITLNESKIQKSCPMSGNRTVSLVVIIIPSLTFVFLDNSLPQIPGLRDNDRVQYVIVILIFSCPTSPESYSTTPKLRVMTNGGSR